MAYQDNDDHLEFRVAPYQFEPTKKPSDIKDSSSLSEESSGSDNDDVISSPRALNEWCTCGNCVVMPTDTENMCCQRFTLCREKMEANQLKCVTFHDAFRVNCLNRDVLELVFYDYLDINGHIGDKEPVHHIYGKKQTIDRFSVIVEVMLFLEKLHTDKMKDNLSLGASYVSYMYFEAILSKYGLCKETLLFRVCVKMSYKTNVYLLWNKRLQYRWMTYSRENGNNLPYKLQVLHYCDRPSQRKNNESLDIMERLSTWIKCLSLSGKNSYTSQVLSNIDTFICLGEKIISSSMAVMLWHGNSSMIYSVASPEELLPPSSGKAKVVRSYTQQSAQSNQPHSAVTAGEYIAKSEWIPRQTLSPSSSILQQRNDMEKKNKEMKKPLSESTAKTLDKKQTLMMKDSNTQGVALPKSEIFDPIAWLSLSTQEVIKTSNIKISESIDTKTVDLYKHTEVPLQKYYEVVEIHKETPEINTKEKEKRIQTVSHMQLQRHRVKRDMIPKVYKEISFIHGIKITKTFCDVIENLLQLEFSYQEILEMDSKILKWLIDQRKVSSSISHILKTIETKKVHGNLLSKENSELFFTHVKEVKQIHQRKNVLKTLKSILHIEPNEMKYLKSLKHLKLQNAISNVYLLRKLGFSNAEIKSCLCILSHTGDTLKAAHTKMVSDGRLSNLNMENGTQRINALNYTIEVLMKEDREKSHH